MFSQEQNVSQLESLSEVKAPLLKAGWLRRFFSPEFEDKSVEQAFRYYYTQSHFTRANISAILAVFLVPFIDITFRVGTVHVPEVTRSVYFIFEPFVIFMALFSFAVSRKFNESMTALVQWLAFAIFIIAGMIAVYVTMTFPPAQIVIVGHMLIGIVIFFGYLLAFIRLPFAIVGATIITVAYVYTLYIRWPEGGPLVQQLGLPAGKPHEFNAHFFLLLVTNAVGWYACGTLENNARNVFAQRLLIEKQRDVLNKEKAKSESLLLNILPEEIAQRLKAGNNTIADGFDDVAVLFADIVGFTPRARSMQPQELVHMLNELFQLFDEIVLRHGVEKIKTIGDAYMVAGGIPVKKERALLDIAKCAIEMMQAASQFRDSQGEVIKLRIGIHVGPAVAGVIGSYKFAYDIWGDTVNTAARMEAFGEPGRIQVTESVYMALNDSFEFNERGEIDVKGIGKIKTWWLRENNS